MGATPTVRQLSGVHVAILLHRSEQRYLRLTEQQLSRGRDEQPDVARRGVAGDLDVRGRCGGGEGGNPESLIWKRRAAWIAPSTSGLGARSEPIASRAMTPGMELVMWLP